MTQRTHLIPALALSAALHGGLVLCGPQPPVRPPPRPPNEVPVRFLQAATRVAPEPDRSQPREQIRRAAVPNPASTTAAPVRELPPPAPLPSPPLQPAPVPDVPRPPPEHRLTEPPAGQEATTLPPASEPGLGAAGDDRSDGQAFDTFGKAAAPGPPPRNAGEKSTIPRPIFTPKPAYPARSRDLGEEGTVVIAILVGIDGRVISSQIATSSGYPLLDGSALATVGNRWRFKAGREGGHAVEQWVRVPIEFRIRSR